MRFFILIFLFSIINFHLKSQEIVNDTLNPDTAKIILLIPFAEHMYYSDAMHEFAKKSEMT